MARRKDSETLRQELARAYMLAFAGDHGAQVLADLNAIPTAVGTMTAAGVDSNAVLLNEGARRVYLYIVQRVEEGRKYAGGGSPIAIVHNADEWSGSDSAESDGEPKRPRLANW